MVISQHFYSTMRETSFGDICIYIYIYIYIRMVVYIWSMNLQTDPFASFLGLGAVARSQAADGWVPARPAGCCGTFGNWNMAFNTSIIDHYFVICQCIYWSHTVSIHQLSLPELFILTQVDIGNGRWMRQFKPKNGNIDAYNITCFRCLIRCHGHDLLIDVA